MKKFLATVLTLCLLLGLCVGATADAANEIVTLRWVTVGSGMPLNYDAWAEKINAYLAEKIGVNIEMEVVSWGDWDNRRSVIVNTNEPYDIIFGNANTYNTDVMMGAYLNIGDLLETAAPELKKMIPESYWDACRVNGEIYAVPTYKDSSTSNFFVWDNELLTSLNLDASNAHTFEDVSPILAAIKEANTGKVPFELNKNGATYLAFQYDQMSTGLAAIGVRYDDADAKVVPVFAQEDVMSNLKILHQWYNDGIINSDAATMPEENAYKVCSVAQGWAGAAKTTWGPGRGVDCVAYQWADTIVSNETVRGSLNSISVNSAHPEKALAFLQLINTDSYLRDSFYYGLEGDDWEYTSEGLLHRLKPGDWKMAGYTQGTFFNVTQLDEVDFNQWDEVKELNENAKPSVLLGFTFDTTAVQDEIANCTAIYERYKGELLTGTIEPEAGVASMMEEMNAAGFEQIVTAAQAQVDAFMASK